MVWLHGGGFDSGTSAWNPGMQLAKKDVVVVSVNHRLNILGFLDLSACSSKYKYSGNVGMIDVVQALQWVQTNIRQFGGDPANVTIFGESGGGGKVGTLLCMPQAKGLFHKAIIMSGTILNVNTKMMTEELGQAVLKELHIDAAHIEDINKVPYDTLYAAGQRAMAASIGTRKPGTSHRSSTPYSSTPLYMYMFTWRSPVNKGSVHGHELKFCFNTLHHAANELPQPTEADLRLADTMSSVWAQFAHNGNPNVNGLPEWHPYTKENGELMVFDYQCAIRNNPDRRLEEIIDKHCFQQLDDFRAKQSSR